MGQVQADSFNSFFRYGGLFHGTAFLLVRPDEWDGMIGGILAALKEE